MRTNSSDSRKARAMLTLSRAVVYIILVFLSVLCLFSFYMLIINSTRALRLSEELVRMGTPP